MKKAKPENKPGEENLPFSFLRKDIDSEKIQAHWQKIKEKIKPDAPQSRGVEGDNQL